MMINLAASFILGTIVYLIIEESAVHEREIVMLKYLLVLALSALNPVVWIWKVRLIETLPITISHFHKLSFQSAKLQERMKQMLNLD